MLAPPPLSLSLSLLSQIAFPDEEIEGRVTSELASEGTSKLGAERLAVVVAAAEAIGRPGVRHVMKRASFAEALRRH